MAPTRDYTDLYPQASAFAKKQTDIIWPPDEPAAEDDIQDMRVHMSEAEYHGVVTVLRLFTTYELFAGEDYWTGRIMRDFQRPEIRRMASAFGNTELNVHAPFYNKINEVLGIATPEFYLSYVDDPILKARMDFIDEYINHEDILTSLGVFSMVEGAILYSSFAFLKHFQSEGKNKIPNINAGISSSLVDETLHTEGTIWLYNTTLEEMDLDGRSLPAVHRRVTEAARIIAEHEMQINAMIMEKGSMGRGGVTLHQLNLFSKSRIDFCLKSLGIEPIFEDEHKKYNPIADWFYESTTGGKFTDLFNTQASEYNINWPREKLGWDPSLD